MNLWKDAIGFFNQALSIQPINHRALYGRGYAFELLGDLTNAENSFKEALSYNPQHEGSRQGMMRIQVAKSQIIMNQ